MNSGPNRPNGMLPCHQEAAVDNRVPPWSRSVDAMPKGDLRTMMRRRPIACLLRRRDLFGSSPTITTTILVIGIAGSAGCGGSSEVHSQTAESQHNSTAEQPHSQPVEQQHSSTAEQQHSQPVEQQHSSTAEQQHSQTAEQHCSLTRDPAACRKYGKALQKIEQSRPPPRPGGVIARSEASDTRVTATATLERVPGGAVVPTSGKPPFVLTVSYRVEHRSGLHPVGVSVVGKRKGISVRTGGNRRLGPGPVNTGTMKIPLAFAKGPIYIEVFANSRFDTTLGVGRTTVAGE